MRLLSPVLALMLVAAATMAPTVEAAGERGDPTSTTRPAEQQVDDNDDTRVEVQLVVLAVAAFVVVVVGVTGYLLRKRLGLVPPPPDPDVAARH